MDLEAIEKRWQAATGGPWHSEEADGALYVYQGSAHLMRGSDAWHKCEQCYANTEAVAHAPEDIGALIEALKACQSRVEALEGALALAVDVLAIVRTGDTDRSFYAAKEALTVIEALLTQPGEGGSGASGEVGK